MPKSVKDNDALAAILRRGGYKATPGRLAILGLLRSSRKPLSMTEVLSGLEGKKIDPATAYRALTVLEEIGAVRSVNLRHGHVDYEFAADDHHHLVCTRCGRIEDFGDCNLQGVARKALQKSEAFSRIDSHSLEFFGICSSCAAKD